MLRKKNLIFLFLFLSLFNIFEIKKFSYAGRKEQKEQINRKFFFTDKNFIYLDGKKFLVKGITYIYSYPGDLQWDSHWPISISEEMKNRILNDMKEIKSLNVNVVKLGGKFPEACYIGARKQGIYILANIWIPDNADINVYFNNSVKNDYQDPVFKKFMKDFIKKEVVDILHNMNGNDYSDIVFAYNLGNEFNESSIVNTNKKHPEINQYKGKYISASSGSTATECFLAEMADYVKKYEYDTYGVTHLITHSSYQFQESYNNELGFDFLDFISCNAYSNFIGIYTRDKTPGSHTGTVYQGYLEKIRKWYPNKPLIITEFGASTYPKGGFSEEEQASEIEQMWKDIITAEPPIAGGFVFMFEDQWKMFSQSKNDQMIHNKEDEQEWWGVISVDGDSPSKYVIRKKPAFYKVKKLFEEGYNPYLTNKNR